MVQNSNPLFYCLKQLDVVKIMWSVKGLYYCIPDGNVFVFLAADFFFQIACTERQGGQQSILCA